MRCTVGYSRDCAGDRDAARWRWDARQSRRVSVGHEARQEGTARNRRGRSSMDLKRIFRGWTIAILAVVLVFLFVYRFASSGQSYKQADTARVVELINTDQVKSALLIDSEQTIQITPKNGGEPLQASWVGNQGQTLAQTLQRAYNAHKLPQGYNVEVPKGCSIWTLLLSWLPF